MDGLQWKTLLKWMIWGVPLFSETPISDFDIDMTVTHGELQVCSTVPASQARCEGQLWDGLSMIGYVRYMQSDCWMKIWPTS